MSSPPNPDHLALLKFGLAVPPQHREEVLKMIKTNPSYKEEFEQIKNSLNTMLSEDDFLEAVTSSHNKIADIPENSKVIVKRDSTFQIRAINPEHIASLTERAFFNSFNLEKIISKEDEEDNNGKKSDPEEKGERKPGERIDKDGKKVENDEDDKCLVCGKGYTGSEWIQCSNENKCRGSGWYHQQCVGINAKP